MGNEPGRMLTEIEATAGTSPRPAGAQSQATSLVRSAGINSLGNVSSRILGLVREAVVAGIFGASGKTSAFDAVSGVPKMVYELLVGGMLSAALVPVLSEYATEERKDELEHILSVLLSLAGLVLLVVCVLLELAAPWVAPALVGGFDAELLHTATLLVRLIVPSILIYGLSGILQAYHYARQRFIYPSMGAPAHNLGLIVAVILLAARLDIYSLSLAVMVAAAAQLFVQLPGLRGARLVFHFDWRHPVVRRILKLYAPVVLSIVVANIGIIIDRNLASRTVNEAITWMSKATFLIQLPLGLVSMAISLAVLPTLSQMDADLELDRFRRTLSLGLRLVLVIIIPAAGGLLALGKPIIELIFEHGEFTSVDTQSTWRALLYYLPGLPFAAIDLPLVFAFYAQKDTVTPVVVGILGVIIYLLVGPGLAFLFGWGFLGLVLANSAQLIAHALLMLYAFWQRFEGLRGYGVLRAAYKSALAALLVALVSFCSYETFGHLGLPRGFVGRLTLFILSAGMGALAYLVGARLLRIQEVDQLWGALQQRLAARTSEPLQG